MQHTPPLSAEELRDQFTYHAPRPDQLPRYHAVREAGHELARVIVASCPPSADRTAAVRKVREAVMTANAAIALEEEPGCQHVRGFNATGCCFDCSAKIGMSISEYGAAHAAGKTPFSSTVTHQPVPAFELVQDRDPAPAPTVETLHGPGMWDPMPPKAEGA